MSNVDRWEMPGYCCTRDKCEVPKKDWVRFPPCSACEKAMDVALAVMVDQSMEGREQRPAPMGEQLRALLAEGSVARSILSALCQRATEGDLKAIQLVMDILGEKPPQDDGPEIRIELGPGVEELAK